MSHIKDKFCLIREKQIRVFSKILSFFIKMHLFFFTLFSTIIYSSVVLFPDTLEFNVPNLKLIALFLCLLKHNNYYFHQDPNKMFSNKQQCNYIIYKIIFNKNKSFN